MNRETNSIFNRYLWFERGGLRFAAPMEQLQEVLPLPAVRPVHGAEASLAGFMMLRELVLPLFDPALLVNPPSESLPRASVVVVLSLQERIYFGLLAERVGKVIELPPPRPLGMPTRVPAAFSGECKPASQGRLVLMSVEGLTAAMGLAEAFGAEAAQVG
jgi:chemotaxis signal transduction protein